MVLDISKLLRKNTKDSNASQVYTGKRIVETVFITDNARIVILAGIEAVIVECETTVKVVVKYSFSIGAFLVNLLILYFCKLARMLYMNRRIRQWPAMI